VRGQASRLVPLQAFRPDRPRDGFASEGALRAGDPLLEDAGIDAAQVGWYLRKAAIGSAMTSCQAAS
jgi:hypothetical protein